MIFLCNSHARESNISSEHVVSIVRDTSVHPSEPAVHRSDASSRVSGQLRHNSTSSIDLSVESKSHAHGVHQKIGIVRGVIVIIRGAVLIILCVLDDLVVQIALVGLVAQVTQVAQVAQVTLVALVSLVALVVLIVLIVLIILSLVVLLVIIVVVHVRLLIVIVLVSIGASEIHVVGRSREGVIPSNIKSVIRINTSESSSSVLCEHAILLVAHLLHVVVHRSLVG